MGSEKKTMSLTGQIMIGMGAGALSGILLNQFSEIPWVNEYLILGLLHVVGAMFIASLVMLTMVLTQVGLPAEGIALIIGVDRLLDMMRTALNVTGDSAVALVIARAEEALDENVFNDPAAGSIVKATAGLGHLVHPSEEQA